LEKSDKGRWRAYKYEDLIKRDKAGKSNMPGFPRHTQELGASRRRAGYASANLDIFWLKDEALEDSANLPAPEIIAAEIVEDLEAALSQFSAIASDLDRH
jgi:type I restriction enzyme M protein